jgi:hypothetical protein
MSTIKDAIAAAGEGKSTPVRREEPRRPAIILMVGGHYTYAEVPLSDWIRDAYGLARNHYDRVGHLAQGFVPAILALVFPTAWVFLTSIRPEREVFSDTFRLISSTITLQSYRALIATTTFATYIRNSLVVSLITTLIAVAVSLLAAYSFSRRRFRFRGLLLITVVFSQLFPYVILITPIYVIFYHLRHFHEGAVHLAGGSVQLRRRPTFRQCIIESRVDQLERGPVAIGFRWPGLLVIIIYGVDEDACVVEQPDQLAVRRKSEIHDPDVIRNFREKGVKSQRKGWFGEDESSVLSSCWPLSWLWNR